MGNFLLPSRVKRFVANYIIVKTSKSNDIVHRNHTCGSSIVMY